MMGIMKDLLMCDVKSHGIGQRLTRTEVSSIARMRAAGYDYAHAVALAETISRGPEFNVHVADPVVQRAGTVRANADVAIADVRASAVGGDVAEDQEEVGVFKARAEEQLRGHGADHFEAGSEGFSGEQKDIRTAFELGHVARRTDAAEPGTVHSRCWIRGVVSVTIRLAGIRWLGR